MTPKLQIPFKVLLVVALIGIVIITASYKFMDAVYYHHHLHYKQLEKEKTAHTSSLQ